MIDYKNVDTLKHFLDSFSRVLPARKTNICSRHQRKLARAVKNARQMALLPFISH